MVVEDSEADATEDVEDLAEDAEVGVVETMVAETEEIVVEVKEVLDLAILDLETGLAQFVQIPTLLGGMNATSARGLKKNVLKEVVVEAETSDIVAEDDMEVEEDETGPASCAVTPILAGGSSATHARKKKVFALIMEPQQRIRNSISVDLDPSISSLMDGVSN